MQLTDKKRQWLLETMELRGISGRKLAEAAGWRSHTYMQRLLRGDVDTLDVAPATRIALFLGVPVNTLFLPRQSSTTGRKGSRKGAA